MPHGAEATIAGHTIPDSTHIEAILASGRITADGVLMLRRRVFLKGVVTQADAEMAFRLNDQLGSAADATWAPFFLEALTDYLVHQAEPSGYISEANADWLIARISRSGRVETETELELLVKALEKAKSSPVKLIRFALEQVKWGVLEGDGYIGNNRKLEPGIVGEGESELVRRMLYAFGGDGNIAVTQQEASVLFDINDATAETENHPAWSDLFVKALANFLMATSGYQVPTRQEALRREAWLDSPTPGVGAFMSQMLAGSLSAVWDAYQHGTLDGEPRKTEASGLTIGYEPRVTEEEVSWAATRIGQDGRLHENEMALINFLKSHNAHLHPKLVPILDRVAA
jgi:hypothetical protein